MKNETKKSLLTGLLLTLIIGLLTTCLILFADNLHDVREKNKNSQIEVNRAVSYDEIYRAFKNNKILAEDTYNDKYFTVTAKVNGMETGGILGLEEDVTTLTMETKVDNTIVFFLAKFDRKQRESLKSISVGDTISFIGKCNDGTFYECELE